MGLFDDIEQKYRGGQQQAGGLFDDIEQKYRPQEVNTEGKGNNAAYQPQSPLASFGAGIVDTGTLGYDDEIAGGLNYLAGGSYEDARNAHRKTKREFSEDNPNAYLGGQVAGGVATSLVPGGAAVRGATLGAKVGRAALAGAAEGGLYGAGSADGDLVDRATGAVQGAAVGAVTGAAGPVIGTAIGKTIGKPLTKAIEDARLPSRIENPVEYAQGLKNKIYGEFKDAGIVLKRPDADNFWERMSNRLKGEDADPVNHAGTISALKAFEKSDEALSLNRIDKLRSRLGEIVGEGGKDANMARQVRKEIDNITDNLQEDNVISLSGKGPGAVVRMLKDARDANIRFRNTEMIQKAIKNATANSAESGNFEGALRTQFSSIYKNDKKMRFLSQGEKKMVERLALEPTGKGRAKFVNDVAKRYSFGTADTAGEALGGIVGGYLGSSLGPAGIAVGGAAGATAVRAGKRVMGMGSPKGRLSDELLQWTARGGSAPSRLPRVPVKRNALPAQNVGARTGVAGGVIMNPLTGELIDLTDYLPRDRLPDPRNFPPGGVRG